jgi:hypothetical protein
LQFFAQITAVSARMQAKCHHKLLMDLGGPFDASCKQSSSKACAVTALAEVLCCAAVQHPAAAAAAAAAAAV